MKTEFKNFKKFIAKKLDVFNQKFISCGIENQEHKTCDNRDFKNNGNGCIGNKNRNDVFTNKKSTFADMVKNSSEMITNQTKANGNLDETVNQKSMAEIIANRAVKNSQIRNVKIMSNDSKKIKILHNIMSNQELTDNINIVKVSKKSNTNRVVICKTDAEAKKLDEILVSRFGDHITSSMPSNKLRIKLVNAVTGGNVESFMKKLCLQNELKMRLLNVISSYKVVRGNLTYTNIIVEVDNLVTFKELIQKKYLIVGLNIVKIFENIGVNQCRKCLNYGHFAYNCGDKISCRWCGGNHTAGDCSNRNSKPKCINCLRFNQKSDLSSCVGINHVATYDLCPVRIKRVIELKKFLSKT